MKKIELGKSGLMVSKLGLGAIKFGSLVDQEQSEKLMDFYVENGGNFIDTANCYSYWRDGFTGGESEECIGRWFAKKGNRKDIILATKVGAQPKEEGPQNSSNVQGNSKKVILREVEKSLKRLQTDYIDILYLHIDDRTVDLKETMEALGILYKKGKIKAYGASNFTAWRLEQARQICNELDIPFFSALQQHYSYILPVTDYKIYGADTCQFINKDMMDYMNTYKDFTLVAYSALLVGQYIQDEIIDEGYDTKRNRDKLAELKEKTDNPHNYVLNWVTEQFKGSVALMTASSIEHLKENMGL